MAQFGNCRDEVLPPLTPDEICFGFAKCGAPGMRLTPSNLERLTRYLEDYSDIDIDELAAALCLSDTFRACVAALATPSIHSVVSVVTSPNAVEGSTFCVTVTLNSPVTISAIQIPFYLSGTEQYLNGYAFPSFLTIQPGENSGTVCVATVDDNIDEADAPLIFNLGETVRIPGWPGAVAQVMVFDNDVTAIVPPPSTGSTGYRGDALNANYGTFTTTTGGFPTLTASGVPVGVTFTDNGNGTYSLVGAFPADFGTANIAITATYPGADPVTIVHAVTTQCRAVSGNAGAPFCCGITTTFTPGQTYNVTSQPLTGDGPIAIAFTGSLAGTGLTAVDNGNGTFTVSGTVSNTAFNINWRATATGPCGGAPVEVANWTLQSEGAAVGTPPGPFGPYTDTGVAGTPIGGSGGSGTITFSPNYAYGSEYATGSTVAVTTNSVTGTPSGGTGPYTSVWTRTGGATQISALSPSSPTTSFRATVPVGGDFSATFQLAMTDSLGAVFTGSVNVNVAETH